MIGAIGLCFLWAAWREYMSSNHRDSGLLFLLSILAGTGSASIAFAA
jgi:hypothetical protein